MKLMADTPAVAVNTTPVTTDPVDTRSWLRKQIEDLPQWAHTLVVLVVIGFVIYLVYNNKSVTVPTAAPAVVPVVAPAEPLKVSFNQKVNHPAHKLFVDVVKHRAKRALMADGFNLVGKNPTPLTSEQADELLSKLDDETIIEGSVSKGLVADGTILDKLTALIDWLVAHESQIMEIVKWVMGILALFGA